MSALLSHSARVSRIMLGSVREQYEKFPYPNYPLLAKPRCADGYLGRAAFCHALAGTRPAKARSRVLVAGCGEMLPYVLHRLEPVASEMHCVDLSSRSLRRARLRIGLTRRPIRFLRADVDAYLVDSHAQGLSFDHFDAYGVLQCLPNPRSTLTLVAEVLRPGGTARVMVYNNQARGWIHEIAKVMRLIGLSYRNRGDLAAASELIRLLGRHLPFMARFFAGGLEGMIRNPSRLVDTFFHARDIVFDLRQWLRAVVDAGLRPIGIFDRYGELDDLANPLWVMPHENDLAERAADFRFENNLELFLVRSDDSRPAGRRSAASDDGCGRQAPAAGRQGAGDAGFVRLMDFLPRLPLADSYGYPRIWFGFEETRAIPWHQRLAWWRMHSDWIRGQPVSIAGAVEAAGPDAMRRLARLGAVLPGMMDTDAAFEEMLHPLRKTMARPAKSAFVPLHATTIPAWAARELALRGRSPERYLPLIQARLDKAQRAYSVEVAGNV